MMYRLFDDPALVEGILRTNGEWWGRLAEKVLRDRKVLQQVASAAV